MKFKKLFAGALIPTLALSLAACSQSGTTETTQESHSHVSENTGDENQEKYHLKVAYSPSLCQAPLHIAVEKGFFEEEGIEAENIQVEAAHVAEAIGADQVDVGFGLIGKFLQPIENGLNIKFTAGIHTGCIKLLAPSDSEIASVSDLKGKKIGVTGLAAAETIVSKRALATENISFDEKNPEVEFVVFSGTELGQALENGAVDVIALPDPNASQFEAQYNLTAVIDTATTEGFKDEYCCGAFVTAKLANEHPEVAAAYTRAVLKAAVWVNEHPEETAQIQIDKKYVAGEADFNANVLKGYNYIPSVQGGYDAIKLSAQQLTDIGILKEGTVAQEFADAAYLFFDKSEVPDSYLPSDVANAHDVSTNVVVNSLVTEETKDCCAEDHHNEAEHHAEKL